MKTIKLTAIEFRNPDQLYTPVWIEARTILRFQRLDKRIFDELELSLKSNKLYIPDPSGVIGGTYLTCYIGNGSIPMYIKETPEQLQEILENLDRAY